MNAQKYDYTCLVLNIKKHKHLGNFSYVLQDKTDCEPMAPTTGLQGSLGLVQVSVGYNTSPTTSPAPWCTKDPAPERTMVHQGTPGLDGRGPQGGPAGLRHACNKKTLQY